VRGARVSVSAPRRAAGLAPGCVSATRATPHPALPARLLPRPAGHPALPQQPFAHRANARLLPRRPGHAALCQLPGSRARSPA
jgi:hypothetical protein